MAWTPDIWTGRSSPSPFRSDRDSVRAIQRLGKKVLPGTWEGRRLQRVLRCLRACGGSEIGRGSEAPNCIRSAVNVGRLNMEAASSNSNPQQSRGVGNGVHRRQASSRTSRGRQVKTSSWFTKLPAGHVGIGISRGCPDAFALTYRRLAPGPWFKTCATPEEYRDLYLQALARLDPRHVVGQLETMAGGRVPVLLCYEAPPPNDKWCHRGLVSAWLFDTLGLEVPELDHEDAGCGWQHPKLHPTLRRPQGLVQAPLPFRPQPN